MNEKSVYEFCLEETLPGIHKALRNNSFEEVIEVIIKKANKDVTTGARFWDKKYIDKSSIYRQVLKKLIEEYKNDLSSQTLIEKIRRKVVRGASVGSVQKLVNMTLKYLCVLKIYGYLKTFGVHIGKCDCPLDSQVLNHLSEDTENKYTPWTKLNSMDEYNGIQNDISKITSGSNLEYDFDNWGK